MTPADDIGGTVAISLANWRAYVKAGRQGQAAEYPLFTDAHLVGQEQGTLGPYELLNTVAGPGFAPGVPSAVLRLRFALQPLVPNMEKSNTTLYLWPGPSGALIWNAPRPRATANTDPIEQVQAALADRYRLERELGCGGMATVCLAHDLRHDRAVAIKVLHPEVANAVGVERFLREIRVAAHLQHPHILPLHDSGEANGFLYYVMPHVAGESLRDRLMREKHLHYVRTLWLHLTSEICSGDKCGVNRISRSTVPTSLRVADLLPRLQAALADATLSSGNSVTDGIATVNLAQGLKHQ